MRCRKAPTLVLKFYAAAGQTVAVRSVQDAQDVLRWMLSDHPGSASVTANLDGASAGRQERGHAVIHGHEDRHRVEVWFLRH